MSRPTPNQPLHNNPTPDDLAGTPVCEEEDSTIRLGKSHRARTQGRRGKKGPGVPLPPLEGPPTADDLAGTPVCSDDEEDPKAPLQSLANGGPSLEATLSPVVSRVPTCFDLEAFAGRWFSWADINACFWPGRGGRAAAVSPLLAPARHLGGVYLLAWSEQPPAAVSPSAAEVRYIGETDNFKQRMGGFANSAGFWGDERQLGHSAGWRWPKGRSEHMWVAFFSVGGDLPPHLATGMRKWLEAVALEEHRREHRELPQINAAVGEVEFQ
jgi:hypothetical protein